MAENNCEPCVQPSDPRIDNPAGVVDPNTTVGLENDLPANPPSEAPGPVDPGISIDLSPPDFAGGYPRQDMSNFAEWCGALPSFNMIQGILMTVLANHFADPKNIINPFLRQYVWTPDITTTKIILNIEEDWDPNIINRKPAVYIKREDVDIIKVAVNDMEQTGRIDSKTRYSVLFAGAHTLRCYGANSLPSDNLGFEVGTLIVRASKAIQKMLGLVKLRATKIGSKEKDEGDPQEAYFVPVTVPWAFWYRFETSQMSPTFQFIDLAFFR